MDLDFLFIASSDPIGTAHAADASDLALHLAQAGKQVGVFLIQNGVVPARRGARWDGLDTLVRAGVRIQADAFSLRERGVAAEALADGVEASDDLTPILDALGSGARVVWS